MSNRKRLVRYDLDLDSFSRPSFLIWPLFPVFSFSAFMLILESIQSSIEFTWKRTKTVSETVSATVLTCLKNHIKVRNTRKKVNTAYVQGIQSQTSHLQPCDTVLSSVISF